jgi:hypothetical protein
MASTGFISGTPTTAGNYTVTARAHDGTLTASQTFTWVITSSTSGDTTPPTATIAAPTSAATYSTTSSTITLSGTAADNVGVTQVRWSSDRGSSGVASGTTSWSASIPLTSGANVVMVTAVDAAGNQATDTLTITLTSSQSSVTLNVQPQSGSARLTWSSAPWSSVNIFRNGVLVTSSSPNDGVHTEPISGPGTYTFQICAPGIPTPATCSNSVAVTFGTADTTRPTVTIRTPTTWTTYSTTSWRISIGGTASDNISVTQVRWSSDRGGSGVASGTTDWSASIPLVYGANVVTVTAVDAAGNEATDTLTVTRRRYWQSGD